MQLELKHLRLVEAIADSGSVTRAGTILSLTQSALSHQLRELEGRLGTRLFLRVRNRMVLSPSGERLLALAGRVLDPVREFERDLLTARKEGTFGVLRLSTECYTCYHWLPPIMARYQRRWPGVELRIVAEATRRPLTALGRGELDVAVVSNMEPDRRFRAVPLFEDDLVVITAPGHRLARRRFVRAEDFESESVIVYTMPDEASTLLHDILRPAGVAPRRIIRVQLTEAIVQLVRAGLGVAVLARWAVEPELAAGHLAAIPIGRGGVRRGWQAVVRTRPPAAAFVSGFVDQLREGLSRGPAGLQRIA